MDIFLYRKGMLEHVREQHLALNAKQLTAPGEKVWVDISDFSVKDLATLEHVFGIAPRTVEDIRRAATRPTIEEYEGYLSVVTYGLDEHGHFNQLHFLLGKRFLITAHKQRVQSFELLKKDEAMTRELLKRDTEFIMHYLMGAEIERYTKAIEAFDSRVAAVEERVLHERSSRLVKDIFEIRHNLVTFKHHIAPQKDVLSILSRPGAKFVTPSCSELFRDLYMRVVHATDSIDNYRDILNGTLEVHLSVTSNHLNDIIKVLTVFSTVFMPLTLIASIYGMNFTHMPELTWQYGYFFALSIMAAVGLGMVWVFKRLKWI